MNARVKPLNPKQIHVMVYKNGATLEELADEYGLTVEQFCQKAPTVVGVKKFQEIKRECSRNCKIRKREQERLEKKKKSKKPQENVEQEESLKEKLQKSFKHAKDMATKEFEQVKQTFFMCQSKEREVEKAKEEHMRAQNAFIQAEKNLQLAQEAYETIKKEKSKHEANFLMWTRKREAIQKELNELHKDDIYLMAPNYRGEMPEFGRVISTECISGIQVEIEHGTDLIEETEYFISNPNYSSALEFAKLVLKYYLGDESEKVTILVNEDQYKQILIQQGITI